jgi:hypothetical protein
MDTIRSATEPLRSARPPGYQPPELRALGSVQGRTQWSPGECAAIGLPWPCDDNLPETTTTYAPG